MSSCARLRRRIPRRFPPAPPAREEGEHWYEGYLAASHKDHVLADTNLVNAFKRDGTRPDHFDPKSTVEPLRLKLNRIPPAQRTERNAGTLIGEIWTHEGLWTVMANPSESPRLHLAGSVVPSRAELGFEGSRIRQYDARAGEAQQAAQRRAAAPRP